MLIVSDAGPLIAFAKCDLLFVLPRLFNQVLVPPTVFAEFRIDDNRAGSKALRSAIENEKWLIVTDISKGKTESETNELHLVLDTGEVEAIQLALERKSILLIDERRGRNVARKQGLSIVGSGKILVAAKERGVIPSVTEALDKMSAAGYRLSHALCQRIKTMAGE